MNKVVESLMAMAMGVAFLILFTVKLRDNRYLQQMTEIVLRSNGRPVTPDAVTQTLTWLKIGLKFGIGLAVAVAILGAMALVVNLIPG